MRRTEVSILIAGEDVTADLSDHLISLSYTEKDDDSLDDLQIVLEDRDGLWQGDWLPDPAEIISAVIIADMDDGSGYIDCGEFEIDEVTLECSRSGGDIVTLKAVPSCAKTSLMQERKTRAWENVKFSEVGADVANGAGLDFMYKAPVIVFKRVDQKQESDLAFLQRISKEQGLRLCLKDGQIIIYSGQKADALEAVEIKRTEIVAPSISFKRTLDGVYNSCQVGYTKAQDSETVKKDYAPENRPNTGKVLTVNKRVEDPAQAERLAKAELRSRNCKEKTCSFECMGDTRMRAGTILKLAGWGGFDDNYVITQATHKVDKSSGYRTSVELVKALDY